MCFFQFFFTAIHFCQAAVTCCAMDDICFWSSARTSDCLAKSSYIDFCTLRVSSLSMMAMSMSTPLWRLWLSHVTSLAPKVAFPKCPPSGSPRSPPSPGEPDIWFKGIACTARWVWAPRGCRFEAKKWFGIGNGLGWYETYLNMIEHENIWKCMKTGLKSNPYSLTVLSAAYKKCSLKALHAVAQRLISCLVTNEWRISQPGYPLVI